MAGQAGIKEYVLERAADGGRFSSIGTVAANGNSSMNYSYKDDVRSVFAVYKALQYRLRIVGADGQITYSKVVSFSINALPTAITIYPVPAKNFAWLQGGGGSLLGTKALVVDIQGRTLLQTQIKQWPQQINTSNLPAGVYFVKLANSQLLKLLVGQ